MGLKLYFNNASASGRAVLLVAKALNVDLELIDTDYWEEEFGEDAKQKANPDERVPRLKDEDLELCDFQTITKYLIEKYDNNCQILPEDSNDQASVNELLKFNCEILIPHLLNILVPIIQEDEYEIPAKKLLHIHEAYSFIDKYIKGKYLVGDHVTLADLCCVASISTFTTIVPIAYEKYPSLSQWYIRLKGLPYYKEANEVGLNKLDAILEEKLRRI